MSQNLWTTGIAGFLVTFAGIVNAQESELIVPAVVEVAADRPTWLSDHKEWSEIPAYLQHALVHDRAALASNSVTVRVVKPGILVVAASWNYEGGGWEDTITADRTMLAHFQRDHWEPIARMKWNGDDQHVVLRRRVKEGESFHWRTRNKTAPFALEIAEHDIHEVAAASPLVAANRKTLIAGGPIRPADRVGGDVSDVALCKVRDPEQQPPCSLQGMLLREIVRQAMSLAARDELGLSTRDANLREKLPTRNNAPNRYLEMISTFRSTYDVEAALFRMKGDRRECLWDDAFTVGRVDLHEGLVARMELLSRTELPAALQSAGFQLKQSPKVNLSAQVPPAVEAWLSELSIPSTFVALRQLHATMREEGESPEVLGTLARAYALMGTLTERLWSPAHKTFKARALLYAERGVARWSESAVSLRSRAFSRALVGLHQSALDDLAAAEKLVANPAEPSSPPWVGTIDAFCRFDSVALRSATQKRRTAQLALLLQLLSAEYSFSNREKIEAYNRLIQDVPSCLRAYDGAHEIGALDYRGQAVSQGLLIAATNLRLQVAAIPDLPASVQGAAQKWQQAQAEDGAALAKPNADPEMTARLAFIEALRAAGSEDQDQGEPSWRVLAQLLEEITFVQAERKMQFAVTSLGLSHQECDAILDSLLPQVEHHPYGKYVAAFRSNKAEQDKLLKELKGSIDMSRAQYVEQPMYDRLGRFDPGWWALYRATGALHDDRMASDLPRQIHATSVPMTLIPYLRIVSPHMPYGIAQEIVQGAGSVSWDAAAVERKYAESAQVQNALGKYFVTKQRSADALRCYQAAYKLEPEMSSLVPLANLYDDQRDDARYEAILQNFLSTEDTGLEHARVRVMLADHFILKRDWATARTWANEAAQSYAAWALIKAAICAEGQLDWEKAEELYKAASERYDRGDAATEWYKFCRRTGQGDRAGAEKFVLDALARQEKAGNAPWQEAAIVYELLGRHSEAGAAFEKMPTTRPSAAADLYAVLAYATGGDLPARDRMLASFRERQDHYPGAPHLTAFYVTLLKAVATAVNDPGAVIPTRESLTKEFPKMSRNEQTFCLFALGWFYEWRGKRDLAIEAYQECMKFVHFPGLPRTLAGAALIENGIVPVDYKDSYNVVPARDPVPSGTTSPP